MSNLRERRIRERQQIYRECSSSIDKLSLQAAQDIEKRYKEMYGENWRQALPYEASNRIEEIIKNEKMAAVSRIQEYFYSLKSSETVSDKISFTR